MSWWVEYPGIFQEEIEALAEAGMEPVVDPDEFSRGRCIVSVQLEIFGQKNAGWIEYPELYPYFRPTVFCPGLRDGLRHYNPYNGAICLLRRGTKEWAPSCTAAKHIIEMLSEWEKAAVRKFDEQRLPTEDRQAEPQSAYFPPQKNQIFLIDPSWTLSDDVNGGVLKILLSSPIKKITPDQPFQVWVLSVHNNDNNLIGGCSVSKTIKDYAKGKCEWAVEVKWSRINKIPMLGADFLKNLEVAAPEVFISVDHEIKNGRSGIHALCFKEENPGGGFRDGWLFLVYKSKLRSREVIRKRVTVNYDYLAWYVTSEPIGEKDLFQRVPELWPLRGKTVAVIGLGCVGAPSALEFARAGVGELRLWDGDCVSAGTICRWPEGLPAISSGKVKRLSDYILANYPFTRIGTGHYPEGCDGDFRVSLGHATAGYDQLEGLNKFIQGADIVYDATAEEGINHLVSDLTKKKNIPYVAVSSRPGGWGGTVIRILPDSKSGCFVCFRYAMQKGDISPPSFDPEGDELQPVGCGDITFKASSFDVQEISLAGVRMAMSILCEGSHGGYPSIQEDVGILHLRNNGLSIFPRWESFKLQKYPDCANPGCGR